MKLRIGVGFGMLTLLVYGLISDPNFRREFFTFSGESLFFSTIICAFILPDKFAWPFQGGLAGFLLYNLLFVPDDSVAPGADTIPTIVLVLVFMGLAVLTYRNAHKAAPNSTTQM